MIKMASTKTSPTRTLELSSWNNAAMMRCNLEAGEHMHTVVGQVFSKYVTDAFPASRQWVKPDFSIQNFGNQMKRQ